MQISTYFKTKEGQVAKVGDIVKYKTRNHPVLGEEYEVIGRIEHDARGLHAGGRYLFTAIGDIEIIQGSLERAAPDMYAALICQDALRLGPIESAKILARYGFAPGRESPHVFVEAMRLRATIKAEGRK